MQLLNLGKLHTLAGPPLAHVGAVQGQATARAQPALPENLHAELEREAVDPGTLDVIPPGFLCEI